MDNGDEGAPAKDTYVVFNCGPDREEVVVRTLIGEYVGHGLNHGRKVYQKVRERPEHVDVLLYYWDSRDGPAFEGWWFGNKLGGTQVWSHCENSGTLPPGSGWKIPWDGPPRPTLVVVNKEVQQRADAEEKAQALSAEFSKVGTDAEKALAEAREAAARDGGGAENASGFSEAESLLTVHVDTLADFATRLADTRKHTQGPASRAFAPIMQQLQALQTHVSGEHERVRMLRLKIEEGAKVKQQEEKDTVALDEVLPEATAKTNTAEDLVEKTAIMAEVINSCGDDAEIVKKALTDTEQAARQAHAAIGEARIFLNAKLVTTRRFVESVRERAANELGALQQKLQDAQAALTPLRTVRVAYEEKRTAERFVQEVEERMALAEVDVDRAEELISLLGVGGLTSEAHKEAQTALATADDHITQAMATIEAKKKTPAGQAALAEMEARGTAAKARLQQFRVTLKEAGERMATEGYVKEAETKLSAVTTALARLEDSGRKEEDDMPLEEVLAEAKVAESVAGEAQTAASMARMFIMMKALEVKRLSSAAANEAATKLQEYQKQLEGAVARLGELRGAVIQRKRAALVREAEASVAGVEADVEKVKESASIFRDDAKLMELSADEIRKASERTAAIDKEASERLSEVRQLVTTRQIEAKGKDASVQVNTELIKFQTRLAHAQAELAGQRKLYASTEQRLSMKRALDDLDKRLHGAEEKVSKAEQLAMDSTAAEEANVAVKGAARVIEAQERGHSLSKEAVGKLQLRLKQAQERLERLADGAKDRAAQGVVDEMLEKAQAKASECETAWQRAIEAEQPYADGAQASAGQLAELDKVVQAGLKAAGEARRTIAMSRLTAKRLPEAVAPAAMESLTKMMTAVEEATKELTEMRARCAERRRSGGRTAAPKSKGG
eukprot:NODE_117_length_3614_cov_4.281331.p1 GENE.NODE_117_length_3614_cov_4.281331~~NODE_117_length_3614_cov_4.281331.p1  ORF type:complete len:905 (-),score=361.82 NODE_117_length_3614_cov_4.281331:706-3420(-)